MLSCQRKEQQNLNVVFDTGSTNLWMASTLCTRGPCVSRGRSRYALDESETYKKPPQPRTLTINFATATLIGPMGVDDFHIGPFTVANQSFALIKEEKGSTFAELPLEGIVGLAFPSMSAAGVRPFFDSVIDQKLLKKNMFAFYLSPLGHHKSLLESGHSGEEESDTIRRKKYSLGMDAILWGGVDKRLYEGKLVWFPVTQAHYWAIDLHGFSVGKERLGFYQEPHDSLMEGNLTEQGGKQHAKLIVDSGTAYYTAEQSLHEKIMNKLRCSQDGVAPTPDVSYRLKDENGVMYDLVLSHEDYMVTKCEPGFLHVPIPSGFGPAMLLGELFMRRYFTVFDRGDGTDTNARIGFAKARRGADIVVREKYD